jgi:hemerythrin-like domain-containing protein
MAPIKRSEFIVALSIDHHAGLLFCWKIKEGIKKNAPLEKIQDYVHFFWNHHLKEHFREEEELLYNRVDDDLSRQGKSEHKMLKQRVNQLNPHSSNAQEYIEFADLMTKHIRFEERILFPHMEATLPEATLKQVGEYLSNQHSVLPIDNYRDEFWSKNYPSNLRSLDNSTE